MRVSIENFLVWISSYIAILGSINLEIKNSSFEILAFYYFYEVYILEVRQFENNMRSLIKLYYIFRHMFDVKSSTSKYVCFRIINCRSVYSTTGKYVIGLVWLSNCIEESFKLQLDLLLVKL